MQKVQDLPTQLCVSVALRSDIFEISLRSFRNGHEKHNPCLCNGMQCWQWLNNLGKVTHSICLPIHPFNHDHHHGNFTKTERTPICKSLSLPKESESLNSHWWPCFLIPTQCRVIIYVVDHQPHLWTDCIRSSFPPNEGMSDINSLKGLCFSSVQACPVADAIWPAVGIQHSTAAD